MPCPSLGPNDFGRVLTNLFWSDPNHFRLVRIINLSPKKVSFECDQNDLDLAKTI